METGQNAFKHRSSLSAMLGLNHFPIETSYWLFGVVKPIVSIAKKWVYRVIVVAIIRVILVIQQNSRNLLRSASATNN